MPPQPQQHGKKMIIYNVCGFIARGKPHLTKFIACCCCECVCVRGWPISPRHLAHGYLHHSRWYSRPLRYTVARTCATRVLLAVFCVLCSGGRRRQLQNVTRAPWILLSQFNEPPEYNWNLTANFYSRLRYFTALTIWLSVLRNSLPANLNKCRLWICPKYATWLILLIAIIKDIQGAHLKNEFRQDVLVHWSLAPHL
jgi:hypothetical protein